MQKLKDQRRVVIENVRPIIDGGRFAVKRIIGEPIRVTADIFSDGHERVEASLRYRKRTTEEIKEAWIEIPMIPLGNDRWTAEFSLSEPGFYEYSLYGFIDHYSTWLDGLLKKHKAEQDLSVEFQTGAEIIEKAKENARKNDLLILEEAYFTFHSSVKQAVKEAQKPEIRQIMRRIHDDRFSFTFPEVLPLLVERKKALFSTWYELFPRSTASEPLRHGTFQDVEKLLPRICQMGFDVLYLPPIHPIGRSHRKGKNNATTAKPKDPGSPWAIGGMEGGHKAIHPELGTIEDFENLIQKAAEYNIEIALDYAIQCSPDHPWVKEHPQWFKWRPDGTIQYAENPPKKYEDVLPLHFETEDWENLWNALKSILEYWIDKGVKIFRVDNPHTKPFLFWEWLITGIKEKHPGVIFLAEAFTRPRIMEHLGKSGFTQSYTYFTWRDTSREFQDYMTELTRTEMRDYFRPNFWPNTPDILPKSLQHKPESAFMIRLILAATLSSNYGIYGPVYEFGLNIPHPDREEYIDSEKYQIHFWDWEEKTPLKDLITFVNQIRKENAALQTTWHIEFGQSDNDQLLAYARMDETFSNKLLIVVNLDPYHTQWGWIEIPRSFLNIKEGENFEVQDLLSGNIYQWSGGWNYVSLDPAAIPAHIFLIRQEK